MRKWINLLNEDMKRPAKDVDLANWLGASHVKHIVFHGTTAGDLVGGKLHTVNGMLFSSDDPDVASSFAGTDVWFNQDEQAIGGTVYPAYIRLINPYIPQDADEYCNYTRIEKRAEELHAKGYDGFECNSDGGTQYCVFSAEQVRLAFE